MNLAPLLSPGPRRLCFAAILLLANAYAMTAMPPVEQRQPVQIVAQSLQRILPPLAVDKLIEARRIEAGWEFRFRTAVAKAWVDEVTIVVKQKAAITSVLTVEFARVDGGMIKSKRSVDAAASAEWNAKVQTLLAEDLAARAPR